MTSITAIVVSDLHATSAKPESEEAKSWLTISTPRTFREHPLVGLREYLQGKVVADLVLVAGDICDKADEVALGVAWADLQELADAVGAKLIATAGNHDLDSRHSNDIDPRGALYDLVPPFPVNDSALRDQFWAQNYAIVDSDDAANGVLPWRVVTLNSAAFHGYTSNGDRELDHGRISKRTARRLRADLEARPEAALNILLTHHHIVQLPDVDTAEQSKIRDGELLTQILDETDSWIIIHGHKHRARIMVVGEDGQTTVFAAGSMSAFPREQLAGGGTPNQAYIITLVDGDSLEPGFDLNFAGRFEALDWAPSQGWQPASSKIDFSLPGKGGFGWRTSSANLASKITSAMDEKDLTSLDRSELLALEPRLEYLSPNGISKLTERLKRKVPQHKLERDEYGEISKVDRLAGTGPTE